jgi:hypothetical protein
MGAIVDANLIDYGWRTEVKIRTYRQNEGGKKG